LHTTAIRHREGPIITKQHIDVGLFKMSEKGQRRKWFTQKLAEALNPQDFEKAQENRSIQKPKYLGHNN